MPRKLPLVLLALTLGGVAGCDSKAQADELCDLARVVAADASVPDEQKFSQWQSRARELVKRGKLRDALDTLASTTTADPAFVEALISDAIGEAWSCSPIAELDLPLDSPPPSGD